MNSDDLIYSINCIKELKSSLLKWLNIIENSSIIDSIEVKLYIIAVMLAFSKSFKIYNKDSWGIYRFSMKKTK